MARLVGLRETEVADPCEARVTQGSGAVPPAIDAAVATLDTKRARRATPARIIAAEPPTKVQAWSAESAAAVLDGFMSAMPAAAFVKDSSGRYLYVNGRFLEQFGDRLGSDWFGKTDADIWPDKIAAFIRANDAAALATDAPVQVTQSIRSMRILGTKFQIHTPKGVLLGGFGLDISEQVRTNDELRRSQALLAAAMEIGGITAWELNRTNQLANGPDESWQLLGFGHATANLDPDGLSRFVHPDDRHLFIESVKAAFVDGRPLDLEFRNIRRDGVERWIRATARRVPGETGLPNRLAGMSRDVTDERAAAASLRTQAKILENVPDAIVVTDAAGRVTYWNEGATRVFGYAADEMLGRTLTDVFPHRQATPSGRDMSPDTLGEFDGEREATRKDGSRIAVHYRARLMRGPSGEVTGGLEVTTDITERKKQELERQRLFTAAEQSSDAIVIADSGGRIQYVNPAFEQSTGYSRGELIGENPRILKSGVQSESFYVAMWAALAGGQPWVAEMVNRRKDGSLFREQEVISPIRDLTGAITSYVAVKRDITQERALAAVAARHAHERALIADTLANLPAQATSEATAQMVCRQVVSLSGVVNATIMRFAHDDRMWPMGFALANGESPKLRPLPYRRSRYLRERAAQGPWIEAWTHDPGHPNYGTLNEMGMRAFAGAPIHHAGTLIGLLAVGSAEESAAAGLAESIPALVEFAALAGVLIGPDLAGRTSSTHARQRIVDVIEHAAFRPVFQPIVDLQHGRVVGHEALTRFEDGTAPDEQFAAAETVGLGLALETATLRTAIAAAGCLRPHMLLNLNASPALVLEGKAIRSLIGGVRQRVVLEITEHIAIADYAAFHRAVEALGPSVSLAVDDAGAGFASFRHILELKPAFVKLDRSLVAGIDSDPAKQALVAGMRQFARSTRCRLIAEGVETEAERAVLVKLGIRLAQGYLLGRPGPLPD